ncbi:MAG: flagellar biosynthetic protein FliO [Aeromonas sp.]
MAVQPVSEVSRSVFASVDMSQWLLSMLLIIGLIVALAWLMKKTKLANALGGAHIKVLATVPLGAKERLLLVDVGGEQVLLGVTAQQITALHTCALPASAKANADMAAVELANADAGDRRPPAEPA